MGSTTYGETFPGERFPEKRCAPEYWLIARPADGRTHALLVEPPRSEPVLPVFSGYPEAEMFVWLGELGGSDEVWYARRTTGGELLAMLVGSEAPVVQVALDPPPEILTSGDTLELGLFLLSRKDFVERLLSEQREARGTA